MNDVTFYRPAKKAVTLGQFKDINGIWHKRCTGPAHEEPVYLPATEKYFYVRKKSDQRHSLFSSRCRLCECWVSVKKRGNEPGLDHGRIPASAVRHLYAELAHRIGVHEMSRRTGLSINGLRNVLTRKAISVRKANVKLVMLELISARRKNEHTNNTRVLNGAVRRAAGATDLCSECGTTMNNFTEGCGHCWDRQRNRERHRKVEEDAA